jgi:hypothetical protein
VPVAVTEKLMLPPAHSDVLLLTLVIAGVTQNGTTSPVGSIVAGK